jgi:OmpA-OmpF porin, OOP family
MILRLGLVLLIFSAWVSWARHYYICQIRGLCHDSAIQDKTHLHYVARTLNVKCNEQIILENFPQFLFDNSSTEPVFVEGHPQFLKELADLLQAQPASKLRITGRYLKNEQEATQHQGKYVNLGIARALTLADKLSAEYGIAPERISTNYQQMIQDTLVEALSFELLDFVPAIALNTDTSKKLLPTPNVSPNKLADVTYFDKSTNFDSGSERLNPSSDFQQYADSLAAYFGRNPKHKLLIIGHTDTKGDAKYNQGLGQKRANAVRNYLKRLPKLAKVDIQTQSKGESQPAVQDQLPDGAYDDNAMSQNRRVNIKILEK